MSFTLKAHIGFPSKTDTIKPFRLLNPYFDKSTDTNNVNVNVSLDSYIDSIISHDFLSENEVSELNHFKKLYKLNTDDFQFLIDSILDLDSIPQNLMNAIDYCMGILFNKSSNQDFGCNIYPDQEKSTYPASDIYNNIWCQINPNPYPVSLFESDSVMNIDLISDTNKFVMPCMALVTSKFGWRDSRIHQGIDLGVNYSLPINSAFDGVVRYAKFYQGYGRLVIVRHYNGLETYYAHLSRINVKPGQQVKAGDIVGKAGSSGRSNGTHLHFEMRYKGVPLNPAHIVSFTENKLLNDNIILKKVKQNFFVYNENAILYTVQSGDYLHKIASEYGTTITKLCESNDFSKNTRLKVGQIIRIYL